MGHGHMGLCVGFDVLCAPCSVPRQAVLYALQPHTLRRTPPRLTMSLWAFFYDAFTSGSRHLVDSATIHVQLVGNVVVGHMQSHEERHKIHIFRG